MNETVACPFCGYKIIHAIQRADKSHPDVVYSMAQCPFCLAEGPIALTDAAAMALWNKRVKVDQ